MTGGVSTKACALKLTGRKEASETAKSVEMMDKFFDIMNVIITWREFTKGRDST